MWTSTGPPLRLWEAVWQLLRIGYDPPAGWLAGGMHAWRVSGREVGRADSVDVHGLRDGLDRDELSVLDVRRPAEWAEGHVEGATSITGAELPERLGELPADRPLAVVCGSGYRSAAAVSLISRERGLRVVNVMCGMGGWKAAGYPRRERPTRAQARPIRRFRGRFLPPSSTSSKVTRCPTRKKRNIPVSMAAGSISHSVAPSSLTMTPVLLLTS